MTFLLAWDISVSAQYKISKYLLQKCMQYTFEQAEYDNMNDDFRLINTPALQPEIISYSNPRIRGLISENIKCLGNVVNFFKLKFEFRKPDKCPFFLQNITATNCTNYLLFA